MSSAGLEGQELGQGRLHDAVQELLRVVRTEAIVEAAVASGCYDADRIDWLLFLDDCKPRRNFDADQLHAHQELLRRVIDRLRPPAALLSEDELPSLGPSDMTSSTPSPGGLRLNHGQVAALEEDSRVAAALIASAASTF